eukprot:m.104383 g.104383  ORF g.104383 m.104383 type:complete len:852 (+) comp15240_c0_seq1:164-2719(+)
MAAYSLQPCQPPGADEWDCLLDITCSAVRVPAKMSRHLDTQADDLAEPSLPQVEVWYGLAYGLLQVDVACTEPFAAPNLSQSTMNSPLKQPSMPHKSQSCPSTPLRKVKRSLWERLWTTTSSDTRAPSPQTDTVTTVIDLTKTDDSPSSLLLREAEIWLGTRHGLIKVINADTRRVKDNLTCHNSAVTTMINDDKDPNQVWTLSATNHLVCWSTSTYSPLLNVGLRNTLATALSASCLLASDTQLWLAVDDRLVALSKSRPRRLQHMLTQRDKLDNNESNVPVTSQCNLNERTALERVTMLASRLAAEALTTGLAAALARTDSDQSATMAALDSPVDQFCLGVANELWCCSKTTPSLQIIDLQRRCRVLTWVVEESGLHHLLAAGTAMWAAAPSGSLYAWHMKSKDPLLRLALHQSAITCLALSPCEEYLLTGSGDPEPLLLVHSVWTLLDRVDNRGVISQRMSVTDTDLRGPPAEPEAVVRRAQLDQSANRPIPRMTAEYDDYGFRRSVVKQDVRHGPTSPAALQLHLAQVDESSLQHEARWHSYILELEQDLDPTLPVDAATRCLFHYGVPGQYRKQAWLYLIEARIGCLRRFKEREENYYQSILDYKRNTPNPFAMDIKLDLLRTFPSNIFFQTFESPCVLQLQRVLTAFAWHHPNIGYCQGLNLLAAFLLLYLDEQDVFWGLLALVEDVMQWEYYRFPMLGSHIDLRIFSDLVKAATPALALHFQSLQFDLKVTSFSWFFAAFVSTLPTDYVMRIWDAFLAEGRTVLFRYGLAVLLVHKERLLAINDLLELHTYFRHDLQQPMDVERLTKMAFETVTIDVEMFVQQRQQQYRTLCTQELAVDRLSEQ